MNQMLVKDSYCNDIVHRNVQKEFLKVWGKQGAIPERKIMYLQKKIVKMDNKVRFAFYRR